ncbi:hypothetical protein EVAR_79662_1 [Eumeta japonica]|uniref:Reverse transcriptase domain-containing protein n=1 Tax=Eumeta variegata TaxID=151549 RepID=A0A4C1W9U1_EUMVA|nr:hypothetical protein EVAR_79662_1 [Eumeta japonica]
MSEYEHNGMIGERLTHYFSRSHLLGYLEEHQLYNNRQYGFRSSSTAGDLLTLLIYCWAEAIESKEEALANRRNSKAVIAGICPDPTPVNAVVPQNCVLFSTMVIPHINDLLKIENLRCYANDSVVDVLYLDHANISQDRINDCGNQTEIKTALE